MPATKRCWPLCAARPNRRSGEPAPARRSPARTVGDVGSRAIGVRAEGRLCRGDVGRTAGHVRVDVLVESDPERLQRCFAAFPSSRRPTSSFSNCWPIVRRIVSTCRTSSRCRASRIGSTWSGGPACSASTTHCGKRDSRLDSADGLELAPRQASPCSARLWTSRTPAGRGLRASLAGCVQLTFRAPRT